MLRNRAFVAKMMRDGRQLLDDRLVGLHFAIQHAQGIGLRPALAVGAHSRRHRFQLPPQQLDVLRAALPVPHGINQKLEIGEPRVLQNIGRKGDDFSVGLVRFRADRLRSDLIELPVAALLRALAAKHGTDVEPLLHFGGLLVSVFDVRPDHRGGVLGPQCEGTPVAVVEGVHLLGDDIGIGPDAAREQLRLFENRRSDFVVVIGPKDLARNGLNAIPRIGGWR